MSAFMQYAYRRRQETSGRIFAFIRLEEKCEIFEIAHYS